VATYGNVAFANNGLAETIVRKIVEAATAHRIVVLLTINVAVAERASN
jgi:hypothetical protein